MVAGERKEHQSVVGVAGAAHHGPYVWSIVDLFGCIILQQLQRIQAFICSGY